MARRETASSEIRGDRRTASASHNLERLSLRFAEFHRHHPRRTRVPDDLRRDTLAALRQGVTRTQLLRACGVSSKQLVQWQNSRSRIPENADRAAPNARVFSVVGEDAVHRVESADSDRDYQPEPRQPTDSEQDHRLELRLNGWSISVRRVGR